MQNGKKLPWTEMVHVSVHGSFLVQFALFQAFARVSLASTAKLISAPTSAIAITIAIGTGVVPLPKPTSGEAMEPSNRGNKPSIADALPAGAADSALPMKSSLYLQSLRRKRQKTEELKQQTIDLQ